VTTSLDEPRYKHINHPSRREMFLLLVVLTGLLIAMASITMLALSSQT
jgi:hypothetical protein